MPKKSSKKHQKVEEETKPVQQQEEETKVEEPNPAPAEETQEKTESVKPETEKHQKKEKSKKKKDSKKEETSFSCPYCEEMIQNIKPMIQHGMEKCKEAFEKCPCNKDLNSFVFYILLIFLFLTYHNVAQILTEKEIKNNIEKYAKYSAHPNYTETFEAPQLPIRNVSDYYYILDGPFNELYSTCSGFIKFEHNILSQEKKLLNSVTETSSSASVMEGLKAFNEKQSERLEEENSQLLEENKQLKDNIKALTEQLERLKKEKEELEQSPAVKVARAIEKAGVKFNENLNPEAFIEHLKSFYESIANSKLFNGETKASFEDFLNNKVKVDFSEKLNSFYDYSLELKNNLTKYIKKESMKDHSGVDQSILDVIYSLPITVYLLLISIIIAIFIMRA